MHKFFIFLITSILAVSVKAQVEIPAPLTDRSEQIIHHTGYTLSYNKDHGTPNWSAWMLTKSKVQGTLSRSNEFLADPSIPIAYRVTPSDYAGSGFDRGHMCPAADMQWSAQAMHDCFYMSNMCPQTPTLNRIYWKALESACRSWALTEDTLYIVCGPVYKGTSKCIGKTHLLQVPIGFYKVVLSLRRGHKKAIGFYYTNSSNKQSLSSTVSTVKHIELMTGIDFFHTLDDKLEEQLENSSNIKKWR